MSINFNTQNLLWIILIAVAVGVFIYWTYRQVMMQLSSRTGWGLTLIRIVAVGLLLFTICEPAASIVMDRSGQANVMLLVDTSDSMRINDRLGSRIQNMTQLLTGDWYSSLSDRYNLQPYQFSERITPLSVNDLDTLTTQKNGTDLGAALSFSKTRAQLNDIAGIIVMTDGNHTIGREPLRIADGINVPVYTIGVGDTLELQDAAVVSHVTNEVAYVESKIPVEVTIRSRGYDRERIPVILREGNRVLDRKNVILAGNGREQSVLMHIIPTSDGVRQYSVSVPEQDGERVTQNNRRNFSIKVLKSKLNVLYIEGSPRVDQTFLSQALKRDPNVLLTNVFLRPNGSFYPEPLPDTRSAWFDYDLVIIGSIHASQLKPWEQYITNFVEQKGGGLIALGGPKSFELGGYAGTAIGNLFPVRIPGINRGLLEGRFLPSLTADGRTHPLTRLEEDPILSSRQWSDLPPLPGINQIGPAKPGATVLATHPTWLVDGQPTPVMAVHRYGLGKVLTIGTYDLWRWDLTMWGTGGTNVSYVRFWSNAVRWLTTREGNRRVRVATEKMAYRSGETIKFNGQVYDESYRPFDGASIAVDVVPKDDNIPSIQIELAPSSDGAGRYTGSVGHLPTGEYTFSARASQQNQELGVDSGGFGVEEPAIEYDHTGMNRDLLTNLASMTGGQFYTVNEADRLLQDVDFPASTTTTTSDVQLWNHPISLLIFILALTLEWFLRRRHGLM